MNFRVGIDIGSTTVKVVVLDEQNKLLFRSYERHFSKTRERACQTLHQVEDLLRGQEIRLTITGSAGLGVANAAGIDVVAMYDKYSDKDRAEINARSQYQFRDFHEVLRMIAK